MLHLRAPPNISEALSVLFPDTGYLQDRRFTELHKIVIQLSSRDIKQELLQESSSIDARDIDGWTPLHWAARRGNLSALETLLLQGADFTAVTGNENRTALHIAAQANSLPCVRALLQFRRGNKVLDIDGKDCYGGTPLWVAAHDNCPAAIAALIQHGANIDAVDYDEEPPIHSAVSQNSHEAITQLLQAGCDYTQKTKQGNSILHYAANDSDAQTIALLTKARLRGVELDCNGEGLRAVELASARTTGTTDDWKLLFERLMDSITDLRFDARSVTSMTSGGESWKSFEDATWEEAEWAANEDIADGEDGYISDPETVYPIPSSLPIRDLPSEMTMAQNMDYEQAFDDTV